MPLLLTDGRQVWELQRCLSFALGMYKAKETFDDWTSATVPSLRWPRSLLRLKRHLLLWEKEGLNEDISSIMLVFGYNFLDITSVMSCEKWLYIKKLLSVLYHLPGFPGILLASIVDFHYTLPTKKPSWWSPSSPFFPPCHFLPIFFPCFL